MRKNIRCLSFSAYRKFSFKKAICLFNGRCFGYALSLFMMFVYSSSFSQTSINLPTSGAATANPAGNTVLIYDNGGAGSNYSNNVSGYVYLTAQAGQTITITGYYDTETNYDYFKIFSGNGIAGTLRSNVSGYSDYFKYTGNVGEGLTIQLKSDGSQVYSGIGLLVTYSSTTTLNVPSSGNNSVACGTNTILYDHGGVSGGYGNNCSGYTVLNCYASGQISLRGNYDTESGYDYVKIYSGTGTGGTLLASFNGTGTINYTGPVGTTLTVQFTSDGAATYQGFALAAIYLSGCVMPYQSQWISMNTGSANWCSGETRSVSVTVKNIGSSSWTDASPDINIGCKWDGDPDYLVRVNAGNLASGAQQTYYFNMTAPAAGANHLTFDVVNEGSCWFANNTGSCGPGNSVYSSSAITVFGNSNPTNSSTGNAINNFNFSGINKTTGTTNTGSPAYYNNYYSTDVATVSNGGTQYPVSVSSSDASTYFKIWIDYNDNGYFEDSGESVFSAGPVGTATGTITISGASGTHKMRVRSSNTSTDFTSCCNMPKGETEDYKIIVNPCQPVTQATNITFTNLANTKVDVNWTNGSGTNRVVFIKAGTTGSPNLIDGTTYTANSVYPLGSNDGNGWYCVYNGTGGGPITVTGLSPNTAYRAMVLEYNYCPVNTTNYITTTATNNPKNFTTTNTSPCAPTSSYYDEFISEFTLNTINNSSDSTSPYNGYSDYTSLSTSLKIGVSYPAVVSNGMPYYTNDQCGIWIDYNQDQDFNDAGEQIFVTGSPGTGPYTAYINPPANALLGPTTLRVRISSGEATLSPCGSSLLGETEDYKVNIIAGTSCNPIVFSDACESTTGWNLPLATSGSNINKWAISSCNAVNANNNSLTILGSTDGGSNFYCNLGYAELGTGNIVASKNVNAIGYATQSLTFKWKCLGNASDYGEVVYSTNGGVSWNVIKTGYKNQSSVQSEVDLAIPAACDNINYLLGFRWIQNTSTGNDPAFTIDDIYITASCGDPTPGAAGTISGTSQVCAGQTGVMYSVPPINNATDYVWSLPSGASITSGANTNTITVSFSAGASSGNITVYGSNGYGNGTASPAYAVTVNNIPAAAGVISGTASICEGQSYVYSVGAISGATSYTWTTPTGFNIISGMGTNSVTINFAPNAVSGNISVAGTNLCGTGTASSNYAITVNPLPDAAGTVTGPDTVCEGSTGVFTVPAISGATGYTWTVPTGASITGGANTNSVTVSFSAACPYYGQISVAGTNGCGTGIPSSPYNITIGFAPPAAGTITGPAAVCQNTSGYVYSITGSSLASDYIWTVPSGATITSGSNTSSITVSYGPAAVSGNVTVYMSNDCGNGSTSTLAVTVTSTVAAAGTITGTATVCQSQTGVSYSVPAITGASTYVWSLPAGATITGGSGTNSITVSFSSTAVSGNITVYGSNSCMDGTISPNYALTVSPASIAPTSASASPPIIASGMSTTLSFTGGSLGTGASWAWYSGSCGGTYLGNTQTITVSPTTTTTYYIRAEGGSCGATACASVTVTVSSISVFYGMLNNGARIYVSPTTYMYIDGSTNGDYSSASCGGQHGHIDIDGSVVLEGDWYNYNSSNENCLQNIEPTPDGVCEFRGTTNTQTIGGTTISSFENVKINNTSVNTGDNIVLLLDVNINGNLELSDGVITTGSNNVIVKKTTPGAVFSHSGNSYIDGNLRRYMATGAGTYSFPLGYGGHTPANYYLIDLENSTLSWSGQYIDSKVEAMVRHSDPDLVALNLTELNYRYVSMATEAMWTLSPSSQPASGTYNLKAWITNIKSPAALSDNAFAILKRPNGGTGSNWTLGGGTINADGGTGRMLADDFAYRMGITGFTEIGVAKSSSTLPVELLSFNAICLNDIVELKWNTSSETNCDFYTIERSKDAQLWETLTTVPGAGTSNSMLSYSAFDEKPFEDIEASYYRLKQTDFNGMTETYPSASVSCEDEIGLELINVTNDDAGMVVTFSAPSEEKYTIYVYDDRGNLIMEQADKSLTGFNQVLLSTAYISRGIYLVVLTDNNDLFTRKIIIN